MAFAGECDMQISTAACSNLKRKMPTSEIPSCDPVQPCDCVRASRLRYSRSGQTAFILSLLQEGKGCVKASFTQGGHSAFIVPLLQGSKGGVKASFAPEDPD